MADMTQMTFQGCFLQIEEATPGPQKTLYSCFHRIISSKTDFVMYNITGFPL